MHWFQWKVRGTSHPRNRQMTLGPQVSSELLQTNSRHSEKNEELTWAFQKAFLGDSGHIYAYSIQANSHFSYYLYLKYTCTF